MIMTFFKVFYCKPVNKTKCIKVKSFYAEKRVEQDKIL